MTDLNRITGDEYCGHILTENYSEALEEISYHRGVLHDPDVVDACLRLFAGKIFTFNAGFPRE